MKGPVPSHDTEVTSVGCDVQSCKFHNHTGNYCTAARIRVENKTAACKGETFCDTFTPKAEG